MRVAIAVPSYSDWKAPMGISMAMLASYCTAKGIQFALISHGGTLIAKARNALVRMAQQTGADWILFVDDDMTFPMDALARLLAHDKDIVGVAACGRVPPYEIGGVLAEQASSGLVEALRLGMGMMLVRMSVFDRTPAPWFAHSFEEPRTPENPDGEMGEDYYFVRKALEHGARAYCDLDLTPSIGHIGDQVFHVTPDQLNGGFGRASPLSAIPSWSIKK